MKRDTHTRRSTLNIKRPDYEPNEMKKRVIMTRNSSLIMTTTTWIFSLLCVICVLCFVFALCMERIYLYSWFRSRFIWHALQMWMYFNIIRHTWVELVIFLCILYSKHLVSKKCNFFRKLGDSTDSNKEYEWLVIGDRINYYCYNDDNNITGLFLSFIISVINYWKSYFLKIVVWIGSIHCYYYDYIVDNH